MWFTNITLMTLPSDFSSLRFVDALIAKQLRPVGPAELSSAGFVSPLPSGYDGIVHSMPGAALIELGTETRVLPGPVVRAALRERINAYREKLGRTPGKRVRNQLKDEVLAELLPRAFVSPARCSSYVDTLAGFLVVDSASDRHGELISRLLRDGMETFAADSIATEESVGGILTRWVLDGRCDDTFQLGDDVEMKDPLDTKAAIRVRHHDLALDEIREHTRQGKRVSQLALVFDNRLSFTLDESLRLRKLRFTDLVKEELGEIDGADAMTELDARFTLMVLELRRLFEALNRVFRIVGAEPVTTEPFAATLALTRSPDAKVLIADARGNVLAEFGKAA